MSRKPLIRKTGDEIEDDAYRDLALSIKANAKGEKLISKLPEVWMKL